MAARRSINGHSCGAVSSRPNSFNDVYNAVNMAYSAVFLVVFCGVSIALCVLYRRTGHGRKLTGVPYMAALFLVILSYVMDLAGQVVMPCIDDNYSTYYCLVIASSVFYTLGVWGLFFVVLYQYNAMLRAHLGDASMVFKVVPFVIVAFLFGIACGYIGLTSYNLWTETDDGYAHNATWLYVEQEKLELAKSILYLLSVVASGALSMMTILAMRSKGLPGGDLVGLTIALYISMFIWTLITVVLCAQYLNHQAYEWVTSMTMGYIEALFQALSFTFLLCIARHGCWSKANAMKMDEQTNPLELLQHQHQHQHQKAYEGYEEYGSDYTQAPIYVHSK